MILTMCSRDKIYDICRFCHGMYDQEKLVLPS